MAKRIIKITEHQLAEAIKDVTLQYLNEIDGATYARIYNASHHAKSENQQGKFQHTYGSGQKALQKVVNNDDTISRARSIEPKAQQQWLQPYIGKQFKFYGEDRLGLVADIMFTLEKVTKIELQKTILVGKVLYNDSEIDGDGIIVNLQTNSVYYRDRKNKHMYKLETDIRTKALWDKLISQIRMSLEHRDA